MIINIEALYNYIRLTIEKNEFTTGLRILVNIYRKSEDLGYIQ